MSYWKKIMVVTVSIVATANLMAAGGVIQVGRSKPQKVYSLTALPSGVLKVIYKPGQPESSLKKGSYRVISYSLSSNTFKKAQDLLTAKKYQSAEKIASAQFNTLKWLGHGVVPGIILGKSLFAQKKFAESEVIFTSCRKLNGNNKEFESTILLEHAKTLQAQNKTEKLVMVIPGLLKAGGSAAAFAFNTQGATARKEKDNEGALLSYMKTFTFFSTKDEEVQIYRAEAKKNIIELFVEMNDNRAKTFQNEK